MNKQFRKGKDLQPSVKAAHEARATAADDASKVIDLTFQRDELNSSLAIAKEEIKALSNEIATVKNQSSTSQEAQAETSKELRQDNSELKQQMDELRITSANGTSIVQYRQSLGHRSASS